MQLINALVIFRASPIFTETFFRGSGKKHTTCTEGFLPWAVRLSESPPRPPSYFYKGVGEGIV